MMKPTIEVEILDLYVEFYGDLKRCDESFDHEFGIEKIIYNAVTEPQWDKSIFTDLDNKIIKVWLSIKFNHDKVCELLTEKMEKYEKTRDYF